MPKGSKAKYSAKQIRQSKHIEVSYEQQGIPEKKAEAIAWATVNKQSSGGEDSGSGKLTSPSFKSEARHSSAENAKKTKQEKAKPLSLESQTKTELLVKARAEHIHGRSTMNKSKPILALHKP